MKTTIAISLCALLAGCGGRSTVGPDPAAAEQYRAAWAKKRAGDEAGYRAALQVLAHQSPHSRAGERAREMLEQTAEQKRGFGGLMAFSSLGLGLLALGTPAALMTVVAAPPPQH
jgi:hypothetical protein